MNSIRPFPVEMNLRMHGYRGEEDGDRIREFLRDVMMLNDRHEHSWHVARWDYWRWHGILNCSGELLEDTVFIWETEAGEIAAVVNTEGKGHVFFQVHPDHRSPELEEEMLAVAEEYLTGEGPKGTGRVLVWADSEDRMRRDVLTRCGYKWTGRSEQQRRYPLDDPIPEILPPPGYTVRALGDVEELPARSWASWRAFHPDEPDDKYVGWEWYRNVQRCPLYRQDLDIVAESSEGEIVSFTTVWYDNVTRTAYFEPVGTMPEHQRRGLARAVINDGLHRIKRNGCTLAFVGAENDGPRALYAAAGFSEFDLSEAWLKEFE